MSLKNWAAGCAVAAYSLVAVGSVSAQEINNKTLPSACPSQDQSQVFKKINGTYLSYIKSSSGHVNRASERGLLELSKSLRKKTSLEKTKQDLKDVISLDIECDDISLSHFIYWPLNDTDQPLSEQAQKKVQDYLENGGFIIFDILDIGTTLDSKALLDKVLGAVNLGLLTQAPQDHTVLNRFYRLQDLPGSYNLESVFVQSHSVGNRKKPSSFVIGNRNWAQAWSGITVGRGTEQHQKVLKAGINMAVYAFTGEYKSARDVLKNIKKRGPK